jgi:hypothetical protein
MDTVVVYGPFERSQFCTEFHGSTCLYSKRIKLVEQHISAIIKRNEISRVRL